VTSRIAIVGRDYGWQEAAAGKPFVGEAGRVLDSALADASLRRGDLLVTNVVNKKPPRDDWEAHERGAVEAGMAQLRLVLGGRAPASVDDKERDVSAPSIVVALGTQAFLACARGCAPPQRERECAALLAREYGGSITELRGYVWEGPFGPVLAAVHPAFVLRTWLPWRATLTWDLEKAARLAGGATREPRESLYARSHVEAQEYAHTLCEAETLACDTETSSTGTPVCAAFSDRRNRGITFQLPRDRDAVAELLALPCAKVWQNAQFDLTILKRAGYAVNGEQHDIMLLWHALQPLIAGKSGSGSKASQKSLRFLASVFTDEPFWKDYRFESEEDRWRLNATDARVTMECWEELWARATAKRLQNE
jgi:uracil-DNA glycosylase family 4